MSMTTTSELVSKLWSFCHVLRDDGLSYQDYLEQITPLLFLKMADEVTKPPFNREPIVPPKYAWPTLLAIDGDELEVHYRHALDELGRKEGMLGLVFRKARNHVQDPATLSRLVKDLINTYSWSALDVDVKGDAYEGLLDRSAQESPKGAGQYFTPRALIRAIVDCIEPKPNETIVDPACGTGGFLLAAHEHILRKYGNRMDRDEKKHLRLEALRGVELVDQVTRLCAMNLFLHGIGPTDSRTDAPVRTDDSLRSPPSQTFDIVLTNPPFGTKGSLAIVGEDGAATREREEYRREDFWATTATKQLNFVQHVHSLLKTGGRAAMVVPDNVLFEGGAGEKIRRRLLESCNVHTLLRLPTGVFYAQGVKANVLFFERRAPSKEPATPKVWVYDLRTNQHFTLKTAPLKRSNLDDFVANYKPGRPLSERRATWSESRPQGRWRSFSYDEILEREKANLDILWLRDESLEDAGALPSPDLLAQEIVDELEAAVEEIREAMAEFAPASKR